MAFSLTPGGLARASARHPRRVLAIWGVLFVVSFMIVGALLAGALTTTADTTSTPDSKRGAQLLEDRLRGPEQSNEAIIIQSETLTVDDPAFQAEVERILNEVRALGPEVIDSAVSFYETQSPLLVSQDRHATFIPVVMAGDLDDATENVTKVIDIATASNGDNGFEVHITGNAAIGHDFSHAAESDIVRGEAIAVPIALIILVLVLGVVVAAFVPLLMAAAAIVAALAVTALVGQSFQFSFFVQNMITMMGLAVGIDYSLFIISRFREERAAGRSVLDSVDVASKTAGRAVFFSGLTVIIALLGMLIVPSTIYRSLAAGAIFVVMFSIIASITLLPAVMVLLGDKVNKLRIPFVERVQRQHDEQRAGGFWDTLARNVMKYPVLGVVSVTALLVAAAVPFLDINAGSAGVSTLPDSFDSKQGFLVLEREFNGGQVTPAEVVIDGDVNSPAVAGAIERLQAAMVDDPVFGPSAFEANQAGDLGLLSIQMAVDPYADEANASIERLREEYIPAAFAGVPVDVYVTGLTAINVDAINLTSDYTPYVFAFVLGLSFLLLMMVFRSIVVPAKAILMNLLSVGAAYGLIVLVSQKGVGADILGFQQVDTVEFWLPLFLFSVLFGLSMDYHVFLLSRIRERYDHTHNNTDAVAYGLRSTGRLITGAALIMVAVFGGFAMGDLVMLQQVGFGLGVAVFLDATVIRCILVPASMKLLGDLNWYLPPVLNWLPHLGIEGAPAHQPEAEPAGGGS